jgi:rhodanese-related sulfurtransferase
MKQCDPSFQQKNLFQQGYQSYTLKELRQIEWGLRFTPSVCSLIALYGLITQNPFILFCVAGLGMWAFFAPAAHPMDLIYNHFIRKLFDAVKLPPNPFQRRLACLSAGIMNTIAGVFFLADFPVAAFITGGMLLSLQAIVIFTHFCTASWMYECVMRALGKWNKPVEQGTARQLLEDGAMVIDVRGRDVFDGGHIYGGTNVPLEELEQNIDQLRACTLLVYCYSGARSQNATQKLKDLGLTRVYDLGDFNRAKSIVESVQPVISASTRTEKQVPVAI